MREVVHPPLVILMVCASFCRGKQIYICLKWLVCGTEAKAASDSLFCKNNPTSVFDRISGIQNKFSHCGDDWG